MTREKQQSIGTILGYVYIFVQAIVSLVYIPLLIHSLGDNEYGIYQLVASVIAYFVVMEAPMSAAVTRYYSEYIEKGEVERAESVLAIGKRINQTISIVILLILIPGIYLFNAVYSNALSAWEIKESCIMIIIMAINIVVSLNNYVYLAALTAKEQFIFIKSLLLIIQILQPIVVCVFICNLPYAVAVVVVQVFLNICICCIRRRYAIKKCGVVIKSHGRDKALTRSILFLSFSVLIVAFIDQIFWKMNQLILGQQYGSQIVAVYSVGSQLNSMYISIGCVLGGLMLPTISRIACSKDSEKKISILFALTGRIQSVILCLIMSGVALFGKEFVLIFAGEAYLDAYYVALLLMFPYTVDLLQNCSIPIMQVKNCYKLRTIVYSCMAPVNLILVLALVKEYEMVGAAFATGITVLFGSGVVMNLIYKKCVGLNILLFWKESIPVFGITFIASGIGLCIKLIDISNLYVQFVFHVVCYIVVYAVLMYVFGLKFEEKETLRHILSKFHKSKS